MKRKMTRESVNNSSTRRKLRIVRIKRRKYFVKSVAYIDDRAFYYFTLMLGKQIQ